MFRNKSYLIPTLLLAIFISACQLSLPEENITKNIEDLQVSKNFDFSTSHTYGLNILVTDENGATLPHIPITIYSAPIENGGQKIAYGWTDEMGYFSRELKIPNTREALFAYSSSAAIERTQIISLPELSGELEFIWGSGPSIPKVVKRLSSDAFTCETGFYQVIYDTLKKLDIATGKYIKVGVASDRYNAIGYNPIDNYIYGVKMLDGKARLWKFGTSGTEQDLGVISGYSASNAYKGDFGLDGFLYLPIYSGGNWQLAKVDVTANPPIATTQNISSINNVDDCHDFAYNPIQEKFYGLTKSGKLAVLDQNNLTIQYIADYSSTTGSGPFGAVWSNLAGHIYYSKNTNGKIYQIEMDSTTGNPLGITFLLNGDAAGNNDGCSCALATAPFDDSDDDEVLDGMDAFPRDSTLAFQEFTPEQDAYGTLSFEDQWPEKGDFDFNDLVIDYNVETAKDPRGMIAYIKLKLKVRAIGASYKQGFGISFEGLLPSQIDSVSGTETTGISLLPNGLEASQSKAVVVIYDDGHGLFGLPNGNFINTTGSGPSLPSYEMEVTLHLNRTVESYGQFNPFLFTRGERGREVHLKNFPPTDLVNNELFGSSSDRSDTGSGIYYQDNQGLPWAIDLAEGMDYPEEKAPITLAYPFFYDWVVSEGINHKDWYLEAKAVISNVYGR
ncbi:MAG: LruC domain-containing protein [Bacteroidia bacterium]|nr:LruC domain-containing protein [Bacteroidia bacterium]